MKSITVYCLKIWAREDHGEDEPTEMIIAENMDILKNVFISYMDKHKEMDEGWLEEDEDIDQLYSECIDGVLNETNSCPEMNSVYVTSLYKDLVIYLQK